MKHPILNARAVLRLRGMELPGWDSNVGYAVNEFWTELLQRERRSAVALAQLDMYSALAASSGAEIAKKIEAVSPFFDDYLSKTDHSAYTVDHRIRKQRRKIRELRQQKEQFDRLRWMESEAFSLQAWFDGK